MRTEEHDLNSLRKLVRELQFENSRLKAILKDTRNKKWLKTIKTIACGCAMWYQN